jgi:sugar phosphate isomerase/epimerase
MAFETVASWERVRDAVKSPVLGLCLDVGHCLATGEGDPADVFAAHAREVVVLQLDDHARGVHDHRMFGEGEVDWPRLAAAVRASGWTGPLEVELSRHSSEAPDAAARSARFLRARFG